MTTQVDTVRKHLLAGKSITLLVSIHVYNITRLSSVIEDLRNEGMQIDTLIKYDEAGKQYAEYRLRRRITKLCKVQVKRGYGTDLPTWVRRLKAATVTDLTGDVAKVQFVRGKNIKSFQMNVKELVNVD